VYNFKVYLQIFLTFIQSLIYYFNQFLFKLVNDLIKIKFPKFICFYYRIKTHPIPPKDIQILSINVHFKNALQPSKNYLQ
jgi:hypothetical protein